MFGLFLFIVIALGIMAFFNPFFLILLVIALVALIALLIRMVKGPPAQKASPIAEPMQKPIMPTTPSVKSPNILPYTPQASPLPNPRQHDGTSALQDYVVLDFETTGLSPTTDSIIEYGLLKVERGVETDAICGYVNPGKKIPSEITRLTGITDADVSTAPDVVEAVKVIHSFLGTLPIVAHNASFDGGFLRAAYKKAGIDTSPILIDTLSMSRKAFPNAPNHKLCTLITYLSIGTTQEHRALSDVYLTNELLKRCLDIGDFEL